MLFDVLKCYFTIKLKEYLKCMFCMTFNHQESGNTIAKVKNSESTFYEGDMKLADWLVCARTSQRDGSLQCMLFFIVWIHYMPLLFEINQQCTLSVQCKTTSCFLERSNDTVPDHYGKTQSAMWQWHMVQQLHYGENPHFPSTVPAGNMYTYIHSGGQDGEVLHLNMVLNALQNGICEKLKQEWV